MIYDPSTLWPLVVVELDEPSHARPDRKSRDGDVDAMG